MSQELPKTQHLILLIGENPLPNYVAANLLLLPEGTVHLAHTNGTQRQANQLRKVLEKKNINCLDLPLGSSEANASAIRSGINERIKSLDKSRIGLHYTGGTKAMAVHAYLALKEYDANACFSYLDSRHLELCIDQTSSDPQRIRITPEMLKVNVLELMELHGWEETSKSKSIKKPIGKEAAEAFQQFHQDVDAATLWRDWCDFNKDGQNWKNGQKSKSIDISGKSRTGLPEDILDNPVDITKNPKIVEALKYLNVEASFCIEDIRKSMVLETSGEVRDWLDGQWLEHYVLAKIQEIPEEMKINDSLNSVKIKNPHNSELEFELDVLFTRGYQLFAVSCTTSCSKSLCKSKLFEAYIRSQQLGGVEARVAFVCCADPENTAILKTEVLNTFTPIGIKPEDHRIEVFGRKDLPDLKNKIAQWIQDVDRDTK
jgi:Domain of unknown function (DUF1887)